MVARDIELDTDEVLAITLWFSLVNKEEKPLPNFSLHSHYYDIILNYDYKIQVFAEQ